MRSAVRIGIPFAGQSQSNVVVDAGRNRHLALDAFTQIAFAPTTGQGIVDRGASAVAGRASGLHAEDAGALHDLASPAAILALLGLGASSRTAAVALGAFLVPLEMDDLGHAAGRFQQIERNIATDIGPLGPRRPPRPRPPAEDVAEPFAEDAAKGLENVVDVVEVGRASAGAVDAGVAKAVVARTLVGVAQTSKASAASLKDRDASSSPGFLSG